MDPFVDFHAVVQIDAAHLVFGWQVAQSGQFPDRLVGEPRVLRQLLARHPRGRERRGASFENERVIRSGASPVVSVKS
ncbi:hypothetical protein GFD25_11435 [Bifidobacterium aerophilum]|uniref:Uncharacterized protein n=1 Tax=Bifidobacterium aerophilum TaxID=1798155 RepID=A0A6N9Z823_9BIFI|nr:hypothetical protein [Bifidobacterium aerophilum]